MSVGWFFFFWGGVSSPSFAYDRCVIRQTFPFLPAPTVLVFRQGTQMADRYATRLKIHLHSFTTVCCVCLVQESTEAADIYFFLNEMPVALLQQVCSSKVDRCFFFKVASGVHLTLRHHFVNLEIFRAGAVAR